MDATLTEEEYQSCRRPRGTETMRAVRAVLASKDMPVLDGEELGPVVRGKEGFAVSTFVPGPREPKPWEMERADAAQKRQQPQGDQLEHQGRDARR